MKFAQRPNRGSTGASNVGPWAVTTISIISKPSPFFSEGVPSDEDLTPYIGGSLVGVPCQRVHSIDVHSQNTQTSVQTVTGRLLPEYGAPCHLLKHLPLSSGQIVRYDGGWVEKLSVVWLQFFGKALENQHTGALRAHQQSAQPLGGIRGGHHGVYSR